MAPYSWGQIAVLQQLCWECVALVRFQFPKSIAGGAGAPIPTPGAARLWSCRHVKEPPSLSPMDTEFL